MNLRDDIQNWDDVFAPLLVELLNRMTCDSEPVPDVVASTVKCHWLERDDKPTLQCIINHTKLLEKKITE